MPFELYSASQLDWLLSCPSLINPGHFGYASNYCPDWSTLKQSAFASQLPKTIHSTRQGLLAEQLFLAALNALSDYQVLGHNIQVFDQNRRTLGEMDFIYQQPNGRFVHLELAVKFYLQTTNGQPVWLGPNATDTLCNKLKSLHQQQTQLSTHPSAIQHLATLGVGAVNPTSLVLGQLFYHLFQGRQDSSSLLNPQHRRGYWIHLNEYEKAATHPSIHSKRWRILEKADWITASTTRPCLGYAPWNTLLEQVNQKIASGDHTMLEANDSKLPGVLPLRIFIAPNIWPNIEH